MYGTLVQLLAMIEFQKDGGIILKLKFEATANDPTIEQTNKASVDSKNTKNQYPVVKNSLEKIK